MEIKIIDVTPPSEKQIKSNIHGTINVMVSSEGIPITRLNGITIRRDSKGNSFLSMPSYKVGEGDNAKYYNHFNLFPLDKGNEALSNDQKNRLNALTQEALRIVANGGTKRPNTQAQPVKQDAPVPAKAPAASSSKKNPWEV